MRKLRIFEHNSLDGMIQHSADDNGFAYSDWTAPYRSPTRRDALLAAYGGRYDPMRWSPHLLRAIIHWPTEPNHRKNGEHTATQKHKG